MKKSKAAVVHQQGGPFVIEDIEVQDPGPGEVLVRIAASGACHSDWHQVMGEIPKSFPAVLGHEGAGVVEEVGQGVTRVSPGDSVMLSWFPACGTCFYCQREQHNMCETYRPFLESGTAMDGKSRLYLKGEPLTQFSTHSTFAEYAVVPEQACIPLDPEVSMESASLVGCAVMTGVGAAMYTAQIKPGETVAVFGCGGIGLNILQGAALCGAELIVAIDTVPGKFESARAFGATHTINAKEDTLQALLDLTEGRGVDHVLDATGNPKVQENAIYPLRRGGALTLVGVAPHDAKVTFDTFRMHHQETRVLGCFYGTGNCQRDFTRIIQLYKSGRLKLDELISRQSPLSEINEVYADMLAGKINRGVLTFG
jgi:S-(hydroxymethyl)glutathione dehydrogenase/alcohol dehydrogenase